MRSNRINDILFASFLATAATLAAAPASAQSPYDGLWQVTVVTKSGSCDAQTTSTVNVALQVDGETLARATARAAEDTARRAFLPVL